MREAVLDRVRPEGAIANHDHTGFGTLLYACAKAMPETAQTTAREGRCALSRLAASE